MQTKISLRSRDIKIKGQGKHSINHYFGWKFGALSSSVDNRAVNVFERSESWENENVDHEAQ